MARLGIAVLPEESVLAEIVEFRREWASQIPGQQLGLTQNIPHVTLWQGEAPEEALGEETLAEWFPQYLRELKFGSLRVDDRRWVFLDVVASDSLLNLQGRVLVGLVRVVVRPVDEPPSSYSDSEAWNYRHLGYRYVLGDYRPHVTLGRGQDSVPVLSDELVSAAGRQFAGRSVGVDRLVCYRTGVDGVAESLVSEVPVA